MIFTFSEPKRNFFSSPQTFAEAQNFAVESTSQRNYLVSQVPVGEGVDVSF